MSDIHRQGKELAPLDPQKIPAHVAIIMDGNGRWAKQRGLPRLAGHQAGTENLRHILRAAVEFGVKTLTIYAFSTENWGRPETEVQGLMSILEDVIDRELNELNNEGVRLRHIGELSGIRADLQAKVQYAMQLTEKNDRLTLNVAFNYGGRAEVVHAIREIVRQGYQPDQIDEEVISAHLYTANQVDPDLIIRTSGEFRVSNFLIWQGAYAEYHVASVFWPDFNREEFYNALVAYARRDRRFGLVK